MISLKKNIIDEVPKEQLCINNDSTYEYQQEGQNNHPPQYDPQQNPFVFEPLLQNKQQYTSQLSQHQTLVQVYPNSDRENENSSQLYNAGQNRGFALTVVSLWIVQIIIEFSILIKYEALIKKNYVLNLPFFFTALVILAYTFYDNYPINKMKKVRLIDYILFVIYFIADIFTNFVIYFLIDESVLKFCLVIRSIQACNLICSLFVLLIIKNLQTRYILFVTLIPFAMMMTFSYKMDQWLQTGWIIYMISFALQILQTFLSFNLVRVLNEIYSKRNKKLDINNIYTGFILFKSSYYIPF